MNHVTFNPLLHYSFIPFHSTSSPNSTQVEEIVGAIVNDGNGSSCVWLINSGSGSLSETDRYFLHAVEAAPNDFLLIIAGSDWETVSRLLGHYRLEIGKRLDLTGDSEYSLVWVIDFPLFEWDEEGHRWDPVHHPFTAPHPNDVHLLDHSPGQVRAPRPPDAPPSHRSGPASRAPSNRRR